MALFVHLAPEKRARSIARAGIRLPRARAGRVRGVYAMPVTTSFSVSHQWLRELKRGGQRTFVAVHFRIPDREPVLVGHYGGGHIPATAARAGSIVMGAGNPEGFEVIVPRAILPTEVHAIRRVRQIVGWRYHPGSHGTPPCGCPVCQPRGGIRTRALRDRYDAPPG